MKKEMRVKDKEGKYFGKIEKLLPASFKHSIRAYNKYRLDAIAAIGDKGMPDLFITLTANSNWPEIQRSLPLCDHENEENYTQTGNLRQECSSIDRPDIVTRVFNLRLRKIEDMIMKDHVFGRVANMVYRLFLIR